MLGRGTLLACVAFVGAALMLGSGFARLGLFSNIGVPNLLILSTGPALAAFILQEQCLTGHPAARVAYMFLATFLGAVFTSAWVLIVGQIPISSLSTILAALFFTGPYMLTWLLLLAPWCILIWAACAFAALQMGQPWRTLRTAKE